MRDKVHTFSEMTRRFCQDRDWRRVLIRRSPAFAVIAPHGGGIEPGTSELGRAIAGDQFSLYCFEGLKSRGNAALHISSTHFDDPVCLELLKNIETAITIHGSSERREVIHVGGLHRELRTAIVDSLLAGGFTAMEDTTFHDGNDPINLCNRCRGRKGVQLEISRAARVRMFAGLRASERPVTTPVFQSFVSSVRMPMLQSRSAKGFESWTP